MNLETFNSDDCPFRCPWCGPNRTKPVYSQRENEMVFRSLYALKDDERTKYVEMLSELGNIAMLEGTSIVYRTNGIDVRSLQEAVRSDIVSTIEVCLVGTLDMCPSPENIELSVARASRHCHSRAHIILMPSLYNDAVIRQMCKETLHRFYEILVSNPPWVSYDCYCDSRLVGTQYSTGRISSFIGIIKEKTGVEVAFGG